jgi:hypothetical protein
MSNFLGGGGDLVNATKPGALLELAIRLANAEKAASTTQIPLNNITMSADLEAQTYTITATLPIKDDRNATGQVFFAARNYLGTPQGDFNPGTGGDLQSTDLISAFVEMAQIVSDSEKQIPTTVATTTPNTTTVSFDMEAEVVSITSNLPVNIDTDPTTGSVILSAIDFLP